MARRVRVFGAEGRAEGIDFAQRTSENLGFELAANRQVGHAPKKVFRIVNFSLMIARWLAQVEGGDAEHLSGAFAIAGGDDRRMDVEKPLFLKEIVNRAADAVTDARDGAEGIAARPQMGLLTQKLQGVPFLLQGILGGISPAVNNDGLGLHFGSLPLGRRRANNTVHGYAATDRQMQHLALVVG